MKELALTKGYVALLDDEDYERFKDFAWYADVRIWKTGNKQVYVRRSHCSRADGTHKHWTTLLHREIMEAPKGMEVDHIDGNTLDCRRSNMRIATKSQNMMNKGPTLSRKGKAMESKYKGVCRLKQKNSPPWRAMISPSVDGKKKCLWLGGFHSEEDAARAYDRAALKHFGDFARTNFPRGDYVEQA